MNQDSLAFVVYMIHACADRWRRLPSDVYKLLKKTGCIDTYLIPNYEILHTQGTEYLVEDIQEYLGVRGEKI